MCVIFSDIISQKETIINHKNSVRNLFLGAIGIFVVLQLLPFLGVTIKTLQLKQNHLGTHRVRANCFFTKGAQIVTVTKRSGLGTATLRLFLGWLRRMLTKEQDFSTFQNGAERPKIRARIRLKKSKRAVCRRFIIYGARIPTFQRPNVRIYSRFTKYFWA